MGDIVTTGLAQIPRDGLKRIVKHIDAKKPLCLTGEVVNSKGWG